MSLTKTLTALTALTVLTACDRIANADFERDRADRTYRAAMDDYRAGRIPQAIDGLKKTCSANPANASARFQLACLLQDSAKDYVSAFCAFREYLLQRPESEKAKLAEDRMSVCEREMARVLTERFAPQAVQDALRDVQEVRAAQAKIESERAKLKSELETAMRDLARMRQENARLKELMRDEVGSEPTVSEHAKDVAEAKRAVDEDAGAGADIADEIAEAKKLVAGDAAEPPPMLSQAEDAKAKRAAAREAAQNVRKPVLYPHEHRPATYVVQEGDTLYKIAVRFYGRASAWSKIRSANKATISMDGRVREGQKIVLPPGD
mgnify:CR=1 FL=1